MPMNEDKFLADTFVKFIHGQNHKGAGTCPVSYP